MPTPMILRRNAASSVQRITSTEPLLPFLYNTRTIRNQHTDALSGLESSSSEKRSKPRPWNDDGGRKSSFRVRIDRNEYAQRLRKFEGGRTRSDHSESDSAFDTPRSQSQRPEREDHIPFEHAAQETMSIRDKISTSTMTPSEKKAFENLLSLSPQEARAPKDKGRHRDRIEDVLKEAAKARQKQAALDTTPMPEELKNIQDKMAEDRSAAQKVLLEQAVELDLQQVKKAFEAAETDIELWTILHEKVLSRVSQLRLEEPAPRQSPTKQKNRKARAEREATPQSQWTGNVSDELVITRNLPQHMVECQRQLFATFPSSQLHLSLLPYLKSLGPTTYALATSTKLYNQHMRSLFKLQSNLPQIVRTLEEMDKEVYDYDDKTRDLMDSIKKRGSMARKNVYGAGLSALWRGEGFQKATRAVSFWAQTIEERMQERALREAMLNEEHVAI